MFRELTSNAIVDFFKSELYNITFIDESNHAEIKEHLDTLADNSQKRFMRTKAAKWLWKHFFEKCLSDISDNLRGFHELCRYFDDFADYENLLFALDKSHRDHVIHSIWVMLLGLYLRKTYPSLSKMRYDHVLPNPAGGDPKVAKNIELTMDIIHEHERSLWCLIALTHDLGYPIQKTMMANEQMAKMISNFGFLAQRGFLYDFTVVHQTAISELLKTISSLIIWLPKGYWKVGHSSGQILDYAKNFERLDHGIMSAYLLQAHLDYICDLMNTVLDVSELRYKEHDFAARLAMLRILLQSVSSHTNKNAYTNQVNFMCSLLALCDELDEFSRYCHSDDTDEWVNVSCRTELECTAHSLQVNHTFDDPALGDDMESFFKRKVDKLANRYELDHEDIRRMSITCRDVRKHPNVLLVYKKTLSDSARGLVSRTPGKSTHNISGYLDGTVNLLP